MLLMLLLLGLGLHPSLTDAGADAESSQKQCLEDLETLLESRLGEMVTRMQGEKEKQATEFEAKIKEMEARLESKDQAMETKLEELEDKMKENLESRLEEEKEKQAEEKRELEARNKEMELRLEETMKEKKKKVEKRKRGFEASTSKLRIEVEESLRKEIASDYSNDALMTKPSLRDLPIVFISAWQSKILTSPQTVTFESFLVNFNNHDRPGGGDGLLDLDSGIFTCITPWLLCCLLLCPRCCNF